MKTIIKDQKHMIEEIGRLISEGKTVSITAKGYSMNPFIIHLRDKIILGPWNDSQIKKGSVVLARVPKGGYVIHRIIRREGSTLTLMGDGNIGTTETVPVENIIGLMHGVTKKERTYPVNGLAWRTYSCFWRLIRPFRCYPLALWRRFHPQDKLR